MSQKETNRSVFTERKLHKYRYCKTQARTKSYTIWSHMEEHMKMLFELWPLLQPKWLAGSMWLAPFTHSSHFSPVTNSLHGHWPVSAWQEPLKLPAGSQPHCSHLDTREGRSHAHIISSATYSDLLRLTLTKSYVQVFLHSESAQRVTDPGLDERRRLRDTLKHTKKRHLQMLTTQSEGRLLECEAV